LEKGKVYDLLIKGGKIKKEKTLRMKNPEG